MKGYIGILGLFLCLGIRAQVPGPVNYSQGFGFINIPFEGGPVITYRRYNHSGTKVISRGYYRNIVSITTYSDHPVPIYGRKRWFRTVQRLK